VVHWRGFYLQKGTQEEIIAKYDEAFKKLSEGKGYDDSLGKSG
jgi:tripartite-type tricarboxylate transporter receptor subunit TctC